MFLSGLEVLQNENEKKLSLKTKEKSFKNSQKTSHAENIDPLKANKKVMKIIDDNITNKNSFKIKLNKGDKSKVASPVMHKGRLMNKSIEYDEVASSDSSKTHSKVKQTEVSKSSATPNQSQVEDLIPIEEEDADTDLDTDLLHENDVKNGIPKGKL